MKRVAFAFLAASLLAGGMVLPAEATGWHHTYRGRHIRHIRPTHGRFVRGFLAGAGTVLVIKTLHTPRVVYRTPPVIDHGAFIGHRSAERPGFRGGGRFAPKRATGSPPITTSGWRATGNSSAADSPWRNAKAVSLEAAFLSEKSR
jgi:hypothetical protein